MKMKNFQMVFHHWPNEILATPRPATVMSEYSKFMGYLGDYYQITPGWTTARTEWWNMLQRVGSGESVETAVKTFVDNANAAAAAEA